METFGELLTSKFMQVCVSLCACDMLQAQVSMLPQDASLLERERGGDLAKATAEEARLGGSNRGANSLSSGAPIRGHKAKSAPSFPQAWQDCCLHEHTGLVHCLMFATEDRGLLPLPPLELNAAPTELSLRHDADCLVKEKRGLRSMTCSGRFGLMGLACLQLLARSRPEASNKSAVPGSGSFSMMLNVATCSARVMKQHTSCSFAFSWLGRRLPPAMTKSPSVYHNSLVETQRCLKHAGCNMAWRKAPTQIQIRQDMAGLLPDGGAAQQ